MPIRPSSAQSGVGSAWSHPAQHVGLLLALADSDPPDGIIKSSQLLHTLPVKRLFNDKNDGHSEPQISQCVRSVSQHSLLWRRKAEKTFLGPSRLPQSSKGGIPGSPTRRITLPTALTTHPKHRRQQGSFCSPRMASVGWWWWGRSLPIEKP